MYVCMCACAYVNEREGGVGEQGMGEGKWVMKTG